MYFGCHRCDKDSHQGHNVACQSPGSTGLSEIFWHDAGFPLEV